MKKRKLTLPNTKLPLDDLEDRIEQFLFISRHSNDPGRELYHEGQQTAFSAVITLIGQIKKSGSIWRGGYDDTAGKVVYSDQIAEIIDNIKARENGKELDLQMQNAIERDK